METNKLYRPKDAQLILSIKPSTLRTYSSTYNNFLSSFAQKKPNSTKQRQYTEGDIKLLLFVVECSKKGLKHSSIARLLPAFLAGKPVRLGIERELNRQQGPSVTDQNVHSVSKISSLLQTMKSLKEENSELRIRIELTENKIDELEEQLAFLKESLIKLRMEKTV